MNYRQNASKINEVLDRLSYVSMKPTKHKNRDWTVLRWDSVKSAEEHADSVNSPYQQNVVAFHVHWTTGKWLSLFLTTNIILTLKIACEYGLGIDIALRIIQMKNSSRMDVKLKVQYL